MSSNGSTEGTSTAVVLTIVFVVLKVAHVIDWSWWWVLSPLWIGFGLALLALLVVVVYFGISEWWADRSWTKEMNAKKGEL